MQAPSSGSSYDFAINPERPFAAPEIDREDFRRWYPKSRDVPHGTFEIGLVLAGAVSAGAYTAGVLDFLFQALDRWHLAKREGRDVPRHKVVLRIITGASAGGINGAIAAAACRHRFPHGPDAGNPFYATWVKGLDIAKLLDAGDLHEGAPLKSLLNCGPLQELATEAVGFQGAGPPDDGARDWLADGFRLVLTLTNIAGVPYAVRLRGGSGLYHEMLFHRDHIAFQVPFADGPAASDVPPDLIALSPSNGREDLAWRSLAVAALATGAFPLALEPREIWRTPSDYDYRFAYVNSAGEKIHAPPWPAVPIDERERPQKFLSVDGGTMNNEPFELARRALSGSDGRNPRDGLEADRAVPMVDPFTDPAEPYTDLDPSVLAVAARLATAFKNQARFKQIDLSLAEANDVYSRFLVAPSRRAGAARKRGRKAIASGGLGGFLGFFCEAYRHHDFMLGRANCRSFLRDWFVLPVGGEDERNPLFADGTWAPEHMAEGSPFRSRSGRRPDHLQIVPLVDGLHEEPEASPDWPADAFKGYAAVGELVERRIHAAYPVLREAVLDRLGVSGPPRWLAKAYLFPAGSLLRRRIASKARRQIDEAAAKVDKDDIG